MKRILLLVLYLVSLFGGAMVSAQRPDSSASAPAQMKTDSGPAAARINPPAKEAAIRRFMRLTGGERIEADLADQLKRAVRPSIEAMVAESSPPGEYQAKLVDLIVDKLSSRYMAEVLMPALISVYAKKFSEEDLNQLIAFYESPLGRKAGSVLEDIDAEIVKIKAQAQTQKLLEDCVGQVLAEHPDLEQAMEKSNKANPSR